MERSIQGSRWMTDRTNHFGTLKGLWWGLIGGLVGTMAMDLILMGAFSALGSPATTCFSMVGNTVGRFFSLTGMDMARSIQLGILTHYVVGPLIGVIFGTIVERVKFLRSSNLKKIILVAIVYVEILSQPMLAMPPILLKMTVPATLEWYGGSFVAHLIVAVILGTVVGYAQQQESAPRSTPGRFLHHVRS